MAKFFLEDLDKLLPHLGALVVRLKLVALLVARVAADGADVDHAVAELDEGAALDGDVEVGNVVQDKVGELLVLGLADPLDEAVGGQRLAELEGREAVLGEAKVKERRDGRAGGAAELLLLLDEVGAADEADGALLAQGAQDGEDLGGGALGGVEVRFTLLVSFFLFFLLQRRRLRGGTRKAIAYQTGGSEGAVDVKEADGVLERTLLKRGVGRDSRSSHGVGYDVCRSAE